MVSRQTWPPHTRTQTRTFSHGGGGAALHFDLVEFTEWVTALPMLVHTGTLERERDIHPSTPRACVNTGGEGSREGGRAGGGQSISLFRACSPSGTTLD